MKTLFLGSYGFGNLGDELCLIDAIRQFKPAEAWAYSSNPAYTHRTSGVSNFITDRTEIGTLRPKRVVLGGGGVGFWPSLRDSLHWMRDAMLMDAELHIHNIGVGTIAQREWFEDDIVQRVLARLASFTVRDHVSRWLVGEWGFGVNPGVSYYPETDLPEEPFPLPGLEGRLVGISITGQSEMMEALGANRDKIKRLLDGLGPFVVVPIVSTVQDNENEDDIRGFSRFAELFLEGRQIMFREMLDRSWWSTNMTPLRLKHVIGRLDLLISQRKHNVIHAIGTGTRFIGIFPEEDDSILRIMFTLRHRIPDGSSFIALKTGRYVPA